MKSQKQRLGSDGNHGGCDAVCDVRAGLDLAGRLRAGLGVIPTMPHLHPLWKPGFQHCVILLEFLEAQLPGLTAPLGVAVLKSRGQVVL